MAENRYLTESAFREALLRVRLGPENEKAARRHLVEAVPMAVIARDMNCSRQNVLRVVNIVRKAHQEYLAAQERLNS